VAYFVHVTLLFSPIVLQAPDPACLARRGREILEYHNICWRRARDMAMRLKEGSPCCRSGKIWIGIWDNLEEVVLVLEKWGRKLLIIRRLFSY
jgi:hypothetical protein